ncbi:MAG: undecaprenyl-diphosphate phosphatase [Clostridia bacterium]|nr:undecaprenyl-diphosphate phosphatase [Clostridia bacterium]
MTVWQSFILGLIQALTEFLPVSSSAHLNIFPWIFGWDMPESFDVALHLGTLLAICVYFAKDWIRLISSGLKLAFHHRSRSKHSEDTSRDGKIFWYLVVATIPAGILSLVLDKIAEKIIGDNVLLEMGLIAGALIVLGIVLYVVDKKSESQVKYEEITLKQSILIGISQAIAAAFPGTSRSGITMTVARGLKIDRESSAKFSFLLATPITLAAVLVDIKDFVFNTQFFVGVLTSFILGLVIIKFFLSYLRKGSFKGFAIYRVLLGIVITILIFTRL